tara:strand:- start:346 stop:612 length:267 start_codon:yes stop_codon:yes gene_type:complete
MATKPLPKWTMQRYALLWTSFKKGEFSYEQASNSIKETDRNIISATLSHLRKNGWLTIKLDPKDARKRIYEIKSPNQAIRDIARGNKK